VPCSFPVLDSDLELYTDGKRYFEVLMRAIVLIRMEDLVF